MELLQNLLMDITKSLRRQELEEHANPDQSNAAQHAEKARRTVNRTTMAANRSVWCSVCNLQTFIKTGAMCRKSHYPISIFLSRQSFLMHECQRLLSKQHEIVIETAPLPADEWVPLTTLQVRNARTQLSDESIDNAAQHVEETLCVACGKCIDGTPVQQNNIFPLHFGCIDASLPWNHLDSAEQPVVCDVNPELEVHSEEEETITQCA